MAWTYGGDPANSTREEVRFLIGDTDTNDQILNDAEIDYLLVEFPEPLVAASESASSIAAKFSRKADKSVGDLNITYSQKVAQYERLAVDLRRRSGLKSANIYGGGISVADKQANEKDTGVTEPSFGRSDFGYIGGAEETPNTPNRSS